MPTIGFLHTSPVHVETFELLSGSLAPLHNVVSVVDEALLSNARASGATTHIVRLGINAALDKLVKSGAEQIVCTCSTIGDAAELEGARRGIDVSRVDRPMAEAAVAAGQRIGVIAALESTVDTTATLITEVAKQSGTTIDIVVHLCTEAWEAFEQHDLGSYAAQVADACDEIATRCDVIVLAQASMAAAADLCTTDIPVLSSPARAVLRAAGL